MEQTEQMIYVLFMITIGVCILLVWLYVNRKKVFKPGKNAPKETNVQRVFAEMNRFAKQNEFICLEHVDLGGEPKTEVDAVLVGDFGVLGVLAFGYNNEIYGTAEEDTWMQKGPKGTVRFENPLQQAKRAERQLRNTLRAGNVKQVRIEVVCVFTNPKAEMNVPKRAGLLSLGEFKKKLREDENYQKSRNLNKEKAAGILKNTPKDQNEEN